MKEENRRDKSVQEMLSLLNFVKEHEIIADYQILEDKTSTYILILFVNMCYRSNFLPSKCSSLKRIKHFNMSSIALYYYSYQFKFVFVL